MSAELGERGKGISMAGKTVFLCKTREDAPVFLDLAVWVVGAGDGGMPVGTPGTESAFLAK